MRRRGLLVLALGTLVECSGRRTVPIRAGPLALGPVAWQSVAVPNLRVEARLTQVCVRVPGAELVVPPNEALAGVRVPGGRPTTIRAQLVGEGGIRVPLDVVEYTRQPEAPQVCLGRWHAPDQVYRAVELRASNPVTVEALTWRADPRTKLGC